MFTSNVQSQSPLFAVNYVFYSVLELAHHYLIAALIGRE